jgi:hypothetical protein
LFAAARPCHVAGTLAAAWFDVDATVATYCRERSLPVPTDIEALVDLHVKAVDAWLDTLAPPPQA